MGSTRRRRRRHREEARRRFDLPLSQPLLLNVGRLAPQKNQELLIRALANLPHAHLVLAGGGLKADAYRALAVTLGVSDRLHILGALPPGDIADLYLAADLFVFPSTWETFGIAAVEAAMVGMPMVVADLPVLARGIAGGRGGAGRVCRAARRRGLDRGDQRRSGGAALAAESRPFSPAHTPQIFATADDRKLSEPVRTGRRGAVEASGARSGVGGELRRRSGDDADGRGLSHCAIVAGAIAAARQALPRPFRAGVQAWRDAGRVLRISGDARRRRGEELRRSGFSAHALSALASFDFDALRRIGFDHMRVPLDVGPLMQGDERQRREIVERFVAVVSAINRHGLNVLVTLFPPSLQHELPQTYLDGLDGPKFRAYSAMVERVAAALAPIDRRRASRSRR